MATIARIPDRACASSKLSSRLPSGLPLTVIPPARRRREAPCLRPPFSGGRSAPFAPAGFCHPERSDTIFSFAPNCGASGRAVEGSLFSSFLATRLP